MTTVHSQKTFYAGDEWQIRGRLYNRNRAPLDIEGATIEWGLLNDTDEEVLSPDAVAVTINLPSGSSDGTFLITAAKEVTTMLAPGYYKDLLRCASNTIPRETFWTGPIIVKKRLSVP